MTNPTPTPTDLSPAPTPDGAVDEGQHTPGPWQTYGETTRGDIAIANDIGARIATVVGWPLGRNENAGVENANLIAAAPETKRERDELLAALKIAVRQAEKVREIQPSHEQVRLIQIGLMKTVLNGRAAIEKCKP